MAACNVLDDLFSWAGKQPAGNHTTVKCTLVTNTSSFQGKDLNVVSYAEGELTYHPGNFVNNVGPSFTSDANIGLLQYFSNRRYKTNAPFDAGATDPLTLTISSHFGTYNVSLQVSKPSFTIKFEPKCQAGVVVGAEYDISYGEAVILISLCGKTSMPIPP